MAIKNKLKMWLTLFKTWRSIDMEGNKDWYLSKTLWVNIMATLAMLAQKYFGFVIGADDQLAIIAVINIILRLISKDKLVIKKAKK